MIDYETFCRIKHLHGEDGLSVTQIAQALSLDPRTVQSWLETERYRPRQSVRRGSKLDAYKATVRQLIERHPYSGVQVFQRLKETGYTGSLTVVKDYLRLVRPPRKPAFLTLAFGPGECAQVDWGHYAWSTSATRIGG